MTKQERSQKCNAIIDVLKKVAKGIEVPLAERINACENAIEVLCRNPDTNGPEQPNKL